MIRLGSAQDVVETKRKASKDTPKWHIPFEEKYKEIKNKKCNIMKCDWGLFLDATSNRLLWWKIQTYHNTNLNYRRPFNVCYLRNTNFNQYYLITSTYVIKKFHLGLETQVKNTNLRNHPLVWKPHCSPHHLRTCRSFDRPVLAIESEEIMQRERATSLRNASPASMKHVIHSIVLTFLFEDEYSIRGGGI